MPELPIAYTITADLKCSYCGKDALVNFPTNQAGNEIYYCGPCEDYNSELSMSNALGDEDYSDLID